MVVPGPGCVRARSGCLGQLFTSRKQRSGLSRCLGESPLTRQGGPQFVGGTELLSTGRWALGDQTETLLAALEKLQNQQFTDYLLSTQ